METMAFGVLHFTDIMVDIGVIIPGGDITGRPGDLVSAGAGVIRTMDTMADTILSITDIMEGITIRSIITPDTIIAM